MTTRKTRKLTDSRAETLANQIEVVAGVMSWLSDRMKYYGGFNRRLVRHAREMAGASVLAKGWATEIRKQQAKKPKGK